MVIGYDAKKIIYDNDDTADYGQVMISALSEHYIHNHYMLYTPKAKENKRMASFSSRTTVHIKTPRHAIIGWKWRRGKGILHDAKRHGARIMHGLNGMLPAPLAHSHMHGVVSIPFTTFIDPAEQCPWLEKFFLTHDVERACRIAQRVITATATGKQMLVEHYGIDPDMIEVVLPACLESYHHNYTDNELKSIAHKYGLPQRFILFNGELTQQAGAQMMVEALNLLNDEDVKVLSESYQGIRPPARHQAPHHALRPSAVLRHAFHFEPGQSGRFARSRAEKHRTPGKGRELPHARSRGRPSHGPRGGRRCSALCHFARRKIIRNSY